MNFAESTQYLVSLGNEVSAMKLGLENIRKLLEALGNPQNNYLKIQVAGTNGKGSVCAFLDSICNTAGINIGTFTSPHLVSVRERLRINGYDISEEDFARQADHVRDVAEQLLAAGDLEYRPTFFEQVTAIALVAFAEANVEIAVLETGLGGRLDATTAANAEIAVITRIDLDHQEYLGNRVEDIAAEKAAIIHSGSQVVIAAQSGKVMNVLTSFSTHLGVSPKLVEKEVRTGWDRGLLKFETTKAEYGIEKLGLLGHHQIDNARIAILLAETLQDHFCITSNNIVTGLQNARHPGRLEYQGRYLFDGAHNVSGATALAAYLNEFEKRKITLIFGAMSGKHVDELAKILFPRCERIVLTQPENSRALTYQELLASLPPDSEKQNIFASDRVANAIDIAETVTPDDNIILVTGSLYLVGEVKKILKSQI